MRKTLSVLVCSSLTLSLTWAWFATHAHAQYALDDAQPAPDAVDAVHAVDAVGEGETLDLHGWLAQHRKFNTWGGATGGFGLVDASSGAPGSFRMQLGFDFLSSTNMLSSGDDVDASGHSLSLTWTALRMLEVYGTVVNRSVTSQGLHALGDITVGGKLFHALSPVVSIGGDLRVNLNGGIGSATPDLAGTSLGLRASMTTDFRQLDKSIPLIGRVNLGYLWDNSGVLADEGEKERYGMVDSPLPPGDEVRHLLTRQERFALGINRVDTLTVGLGGELPIEVARDFYLHPLVEWQWGIPVNRQGYDCPAVVGAVRPGEVDGTHDSCLDREGLSAWPMTLSFGLRAVTPLRGISGFLGADFGLTGTSKFVRELAPTAPYRVLVGLSVDYDARPTPLQIVEREVTVEVAPEIAVVGRVSGTVAEQGLGTPVAGATLAIVGAELSALTADADGRFTTYDLPPGEVQFTVTHPDYLDGSCSGVIPAEGGVVQTSCSLTQRPRVGRVEGRVVDLWGGPVSGVSVTLTGPSSTTLTTDSSGRFAQQELAAGEYTARVATDAHHVRVATVRVAVRQTSTVDLVLAPLPAQRLVTLKPTELVVRGNVRFARGSSDPDPKALPALAEVADALLRNESLRVRIEGFFDAGGDQMQGLTRALSIRQWLVDAGVSPERLTAVGGTQKRIVFAIEP